MEQIGKQVGVPGNYWKGRMTAEEKETIYKCTIRDYSILHTFEAGVKGIGWQLHEMGPDGTGSLEHGDASGEIFWMPNADFLKHYYETFPDQKPQPSKPIDVEAAIVDLSQMTPDKPDVHPDFPNIRLSSSAPVFKYFSICSDTLQEMGPKAGQFAAAFECMIPGHDGTACGTKRRIYHKRGKGVSTSNLITHVREKAAVCPVHAEALKGIEAASKNYVDIDGESVAIYNFSEAFTHHVDLMWLLTKGVSWYTTQSDEFRDFARGYDPRATFPHPYTANHLAEATAALQKKRRIAKFARKKVIFKGRACVGIQLDMWWCTETQTAFAAATATTVEEPTANSPSAQLFLESEVLAFEKFPYGSKTGDNIKLWLEGVLGEYAITIAMTSGVTPDGAADGQCGLAKIDGLGEKVSSTPLPTRCVLPSRPPACLQCEVQRASSVPTLLPSPLPVCRWTHASCTSSSVVSLPPSAWHTRRA